VPISWILASFHLLALGLGLGGVWVRGRSLLQAPDDRAIRRALAADNVWGIAAALWIVTGVMRAFGGYEKGAAYYLHSHAFLAKMTLFLGVLALELWPMIVLIGWRMALRRGAPVQTRHARALARISFVETVLVVGMVFFATAMARGLWF
jgi:putative membrane protein